MRLLIGEISSYKAIVIAKYIDIIYKDITLYSYDYKRYTLKIKTKYSNKHYLLTKNHIDSYIAQISEIIDKQKIDYFIPVHSKYIGEILKNKEKFGNSLSYLGSYLEYFKLHEKNILYGIAGKLDIRIPQKYSNYDDAPIPFIGKPAEGSSADGVVYIFNEKDRKRYAKNNYNNYIFQEYIEGSGCGYSVYAYKGDIRTGYGHIRLAEFPVSGGSSIYRDTFYRDEMRTIVKKVFTVIPWTGFAMFEFKLTPKNELVLIEVNPRIWGSINQGLKNGVNYFESFLGHTENKFENNIKTYLSPFIYFTLLQYLFKGDLNPILTFIRNIKYNKADVSFWDDPKGWLSIILRKIL